LVGRKRRASIRGNVATKWGDTPSEVWCGNLKEADHLEDKETDGIIILK
jgi:hypothetical protein